MQILIDISAEDFEKVKYGRGAVSMMRKAIQRGIPLPKGHGDLIDRTKLYNQTSAWEAQALEQVNKYNPEDNRDEWRWWSAVLKERGAFKHDVENAPTIIEAESEGER